MKALALVEGPDHVCCRYRIRAFEPGLARAGIELAVEGLEPGPIDRLLQLRRVSRFDSVILQRKFLPGWQFGLLRRHARRLVFDFDDAVLYRDSYDPRGPHCRRRAARFARTVSEADVVLAGNEFLAECARAAGAAADRVRVIPTCVDASRYRPQWERPRGPGLDLTWVGSSSTVKGLELRKDLWARLAAEVPSARLRLICDRFPDFSPMPVVEVSWSEESEADAIASGDVGISWIPDDLWSRGKCGLKVLQYQAAGLPVVANPVGVHPTLIQPGVTGFLPETTEEWVEAVRTLADDPEGRLRMGEAAREALVENYSVGAWADAFASAVLPPQPGMHRDEAVPAPASTRLRGPAHSTRTPLRQQGSTDSHGTLG